MAKLEVTETPIFSGEVEKLEITTPAHATEFNQINTRLLENEIYLNESKADKSIIKEAILQSANWTGAAAPYSYTLLLAEATQTNHIELLPPTNITVAQYEAMAEAGIVGGNQSIGSITLLAYGDKPTIDLPIVILVRGD